MENIEDILYKIDIILLLIINNKISYIKSFKDKYIIFKT